MTDGGRWMSKARLVGLILSAGWGPRPVSTLPANMAPWILGWCGVSRRKKDKTLGDKPSNDKP